MRILTWIINWDIVTLVLWEGHMADRVGIPYRDLTPIGRISPSTLCLGIPWVTPCIVREVPPTMRGSCPSLRFMKLNAWDTCKGLWAGATAPTYGSRIILWFTFLFFSFSCCICKDRMGLHIVLFNYVLTFLLFTWFLFLFLVRY